MRYFSVYVVFAPIAWLQNILTLKLITMQKVTTPLHLNKLNPLKWNVVQSPSWCSPRNWEYISGDWRDHLRGQQCTLQFITTGLKATNWGSLCKPNLIWFAKLKQFTWSNQSWTGKLIPQTQCLPTASNAFSRSTTSNHSHTPNHKFLGVQIVLEPIVLLANKSTTD